MEEEWGLERDWGKVDQIAFRGASRIVTSIGATPQREEVGTAEKVACLSGFHSISDMAVVTTGSLSMLEHQSRRAV